jgi:hypothetical protein
MDPAWKTAVSDAAVAALLTGLSEGVELTDMKLWLPALKASIDDYRSRSTLKSDPLFAEAYGKVRNLLLTIFEREVKKGATLLTIADEHGRRIPRATKGGKTTEQIMMMPYIAALCLKYWGFELGQLILAPFWQTRIAREMAHTRATRALTRELRLTGAECETIETSVGRAEVIRCLPAELPISEGVTMTAESWVIDFEAGAQVSSPSAINRFLQTNNNGLGYTIFRDGRTGTIVLSKGSSTPQSEWETVCGALIEDEGSSDNADGSLGCWHATRGAAGLAGFLLNGNPAHRYVPKSAIDAGALADIVEWAQGGSELNDGADE